MPVRGSAPSANGGPPASSVAEGSGATLPQANTGKPLEAFVHALSRNLGNISVHQPDTDAWVVQLVVLTVAALTTVALASTTGAAVVVVHSIISL